MPSSTSKPRTIPHFRLQLVPLDSLQAISVSKAAGPLGSTAARPDVVVVPSSPAEGDQVHADDVGLRIATEGGVDLSRRLRRARSVGTAGEVVTVDLEDDTLEQLIVLGMGDRSVESCRKAGASLAPAIEHASVVRAAVTASLSHAELGAFCEGLLLASYRFSRKSAVTQQREVTVQLAVAGLASTQQVLDQVLAQVSAVTVARDLGNRPSNEKNPTWLAQRAMDLGRASGLRVRVIDQAGLERGRFGGLLAVGAGSSDPPSLVVMEYRGDPGAPKVVLVGKGITFDSGGLSLKPADSMPLMKTDMSGAGTVLATMSALGTLGIRANVTALLACAENMPSGSAYRPGDVVRHYGGRTSEVMNTDAEGRMVLADALAYADARLSPDVIVDVATLTGAATMGLSREYGALFSDDSGLAAQLLDAGNASGDRLWRLPLVPEYRSALDSSVADISHVSRENIGGGAITAALFLREFVGDRRWAHLDIAGPARAEKAKGDRTLGATGFGVRLLLNWLQNSPELW